MATSEKWNPPRDEEPKSATSANVTEEFIRDNCELKVMEDCLTQDTALVESVAVQTSNQDLLDDKEEALLKSQTTKETDSKATLETLTDLRTDCECSREEQPLHMNKDIVLEISADSTSVGLHVLDLKSPDTCYVEMDSSDCDQDACRICHCGNEVEPLISPCLCTGSVKFVHHSCLMSWLQRVVMSKCELCLYPLAVQRKRKPFKKWRLPEEKPIPLIWLMAFVVAMTLNVSSLANDGTQRCTSNPCIIFYVLGSAGALLGVAFFYHWSKKSATYVRKWIAQNEEWRLEGPTDLLAQTGHPNLAFSTKSLTESERSQPAQVT